MNPAIDSVVLLICCLLSSFFAASETALFSLSKLDKRRLEEHHPHVARWIKSHLENPRRTLITIVIGNLLVNTAAAALVTLIAFELWGAVGIGPALFIFTLLMVLIGDILPKVFAIRNKELFSVLAAPFLAFFAFLFSPLRTLTRLVTDHILGFLLKDAKEHTDVISQDELKTLVKIGEEAGILDRQERYMLQKFFELGERQVRAIMTPRIDVVGLNINDSRTKHIELIKKFHFNSFPVYESTLDHLLGMISVQEYMLQQDKDPKSLIEQPLYVPGTKRIDELLTEFREKKLNFAVCVDEYGGTAGIVTLEDVLEEIFGEFYDEYAQVTNPVRPFGNREYLVESKMTLADFNEYFSLHLKAREATTLGGFILEKLGEVPGPGKTLSAEGCEIKIHDVMRQRIRSVVVKLKS